MRCTPISRNFHWLSSTITNRKGFFSTLESKTDFEFLLPSYLGNLDEDSNTVTCLSDYFPFTAEIVCQWATDNLPLKTSCRTRYRSCSLKFLEYFSQWLNTFNFLRWVWSQREQYNILSLLLTTNSSSETTASSFAARCFFRNNVK